MFELIWKKCLLLFKIRRSKCNFLKSKWFSIGVDAPKAQKLDQESAFAKHLLDKNPGDTIDFGNGFKVLEVKKFLSK